MSRHTIGRCAQSGESRGEEKARARRVPEGFDNSWRLMNNVWGNARIHEARGRRRDDGGAADSLPPYIP